MRAAVLLLLLPAAACTGADRRFPSLLPRPIEARGFAEPTPPPPDAVTIAPDPALDMTVAQDRAALTASEAMFGKAERRAAALTSAARGDRAGGERWLAAQTALADLDAQRAATSDAANDLDSRAADRAATLQPDYPALETARTLAHAQLDAEAKRITDLEALLPPG